MSDPPPARTQERVKVAILGGGCGGLSAAWELTATPALRERFDVTVYQLDWQLGGKGASGRSPVWPRTPRRGHRIEEHGLHIWFGFYAHAFRMLQGAYEEAGLAAGPEWWRVPFEKCDSVCLYDQREDGTWSRQSITLPRRGGAERGPPTELRRPPLVRVIARTARLVANGLRGELAPRRPRRGTESEAADGLAAAASVLDQLATEIDRMPSAVGLDADEASGQVARGAHVVVTPPPTISNAAVEPLLDQLFANVGELQSQLRTPDTSDRARLWRGVLELVSASLAGIVRDGVLWRGLATLDQEDLREWLGRHGASEETLARSPVLRGLYDLTFAYQGGDKQRPSLAAGKGLQSLLMMINYEGSFMWRMRAGMGDVVFAPLYLALKERGVRFQFFCRVTRLRVMPGRPVIEVVEVSRDATVTAGSHRYEPIERIGDWWCWPATPYEDQLSDVEPTTEALTRGVDFDQVVLAIPVGALGEICTELTQADPRFRQMLDRSETVQTKALQVWLTRPVSELRDPRGDDGLDPPATAFAEPFDTYCDMSQVLEAEAHDGKGPRGVAYFCSVLPDGAAKDQPDRSARDEAVRYLEHEAIAMWPGAFRDGAFDWNVVFDPLERGGRDRLDAQYFRANTEPTDRYVTTPAGSVDSRLDPGESGFANLVLAGDWTRSGIDGGCVEAAVISGKRAAGAIIARPAGPSRHAYQRGAYVEYGALATAPGPLLCERARLYCFVVKTDRARVQQLCDRVFKQPTGGALRYRVPRLLPVVITFGTIAGLSSLHPAHAGRGSASEPEAAIWVPTIAQRFESGRYVDDHLAIFMPYIWVDDPIAFASGREVYGFAKTQGWMRNLGDPRALAGREPGSGAPDPPDELVLDVHGAAEYRAGAELGRRRLVTIRRSARVRGGAPIDHSPGVPAEGADLSTLVAELLSELDPGSDWERVAPAQRSVGEARARGFARQRPWVLGELLSAQAVRHVFLKQIRDAAQGDLAALQQIVEARSSVTPGSLHWRRLPGRYKLSVEPLASHPLEAELGLAPEQTITFAFAAEFGFRMEPGVIRWPDA